jgi:hypothetical protein
MKSFFLFFSLSSVKEQPAWCRFTAKIWNVSTYGFVDKARYHFAAKQPEI